ncbi:MAG: 3'-5' exoribonuclease domain-containing protein [Shewanella sp.]
MEQNTAPAPKSTGVPSIMSAPVIRLPNIIIGADVESKSMRADAYILSIGLTAWDVATMRLIGAFYDTIDPNDEIAKGIFHEDPATMAWWAGMSDTPEFCPSEEARIEAFSGTRKMPEVLWDARNFLEKFKGQQVGITMRGPDFDSPIIMNAMSQCNVPTSLFRRFSALESDRTAERIMHAFDLAPDYEAESCNWTRGKNAYSHHAGFDSAREAYTTARIYHLAMILRKFGWERMIEAHHALRSGDYCAMDFLK